MAKKGPQGKSKAKSGPAKKPTLAPQPGPGGNAASIPANSGSVPESASRLDWVKAKIRFLVGLLQRATKIYPASKPAWAIVALAGAAGVAVFIAGSPGWALLYVLAAFIFTLGFDKAARDREREHSKIAIAYMVLCLTAIGAITALLIGCAFFEWPRSLTDIGEKTKYDDATKHDALIINTNDPDFEQADPRQPFLALHIEATPKTNLWPSLSIENLSAITANSPKLDLRLYDVDAKDPAGSKCHPDLQTEIGDAGPPMIGHKIRGLFPVKDYAKRWNLTAKGHNLFGTVSLGCENCKKHDYWIKLAVGDPGGRFWARTEPEKHQEQVLHDILCVQEKFDADQYFSIGGAPTTAYQKAEGPVKTALDTDFDPSGFVTWNGHFWAPSRPGDDEVTFHFLGGGLDPESDFDPRSSYVVLASQQPVVMNGFNNFFQRHSLKCKQLSDYQVQMEGGYNVRLTKVSGTNLKLCISRAGGSTTEPQCYGVDSRWTDIVPHLAPGDTINLREGADKLIPHQCDLESTQHTLHWELQENGNHKTSATFEVAYINPIPAPAIQK